jgi:hypothetical protein
MTTQIKSLMFVAAVAILPVACGTSGSPTGMEIAAVELEARRGNDPMPTPPTNAPGDPGSVPVPDVKPDVKPVETTPDPTSVPLPLPTDRQNGARPTAPIVPPSEPSNPEAEPVEPQEPSDTAPPAPPQAPSDTAPQVTIPTTPQVTIPTTPQAPNVPAPAPPLPETDECLAVSMEIAFEGAAFGSTGDRYRATVIGKSGIEITDLSCEKLVWEVSDSAGTVLTVTTEGTRYAIVNGDGRAYKIGVTAPNGVSASMVLGGVSNTGSR